MRVVCGDWALDTTTRQILRRGGDVHVPQLAVTPPQPSPCTPHLPGKFAQVSGVQVGGLTHEVRSKSMNSSSFSCGVRAPGEHSAGKNSVLLPPEFSTWKSL